MLLSIFTKYIKPNSADTTKIAYSVLWILKLATISLPGLRADGFYAPIYLTDCIGFTWGRLPYHV